MTLPAPFTFVIPLRSKAASKDWRRVCRLLRDTVRSALNQTDPDFRVVIVCDDVPDLDNITDPRVEIIQARFPTPHTLHEQALDKRAKKRIASTIIHERGGGLIMLLDSDDFVSNRLVEYVRSGETAKGYYFPTGYEYFAEDAFLNTIEDFHRLCGSCYVINYAIDELPASVEAPETPFDAFKNHRLVLETAEELGWTLVPLPFPGAVYLRENGENHSVQVKAQSTRRISRYRLKATLARLARRISSRSALTEDLIREFSLPVRSDSV